jgi:hypothetical protein
MKKLYSFFLVFSISVSFLAFSMEKEGEAPAGEGKSVSRRGGISAQEIDELRAFFENEPCWQDFSRIDDVELGDDPEDLSFVASFLDAQALMMLYVESYVRESNLYRSLYNLFGKTYPQFMKKTEKGRQIVFDAQAAHLAEVRRAVDEGEGDQYKRICELEKDFKDDSSASAFLLYKKIKIIFDSWSLHGKRVRKLVVYLFSADREKIKKLGPYAFPFVSMCFLDNFTNVEFRGICCKYEPLFKDFYETCVAKLCSITDGESPLRKSGFLSGRIFESELIKHKPSSTKKTVSKIDVIEWKKNATSQLLALNRFSQWREKEKLPLIDLEIYKKEETHITVERLVRKKVVDPGFVRQKGGIALFYKWVLRHCAQFLSLQEKYMRILSDQREVWSALNVVREESLYDEFFIVNSIGAKQWRLLGYLFFPSMQEVISQKRKIFALSLGAREKLRLFDELIEKYSSNKQWCAFLYSSKNRLLESIYNRLKREENTVVKKMIEKVPFEYVIHYLKGYCYPFFAHISLLDQDCLIKQQILKFVSEDELVFLSDYYHENHHKFDELYRGSRTLLERMVRQSSAETKIFMRDLSPSLMREPVKEKVLVEEIKDEKSKRSKGKRKGKTKHKAKRVSQRVLQDKKGKEEVSPDDGCEQLALDNVMPEVVGDDISVDEMAAWLSPDSITRVAVSPVASESPCSDEAAFLRCEYHPRVMGWHENPFEAVEKEIEQHQWLQAKDVEEMVTDHRIPLGIEDSYRQYAISGCFHSEKTGQDFETLLFPGAIQQGDEIRIGYFEIGYLSDDRSKNVVHRFFRPLHKADAELKVEIERRKRMFDDEADEIIDSGKTFDGMVYERASSVTIDDERGKALYILFKPE